MICKTDSSYVFESVEELSIHFHKIDLRRASSDITTPLWLEIKKATINKKTRRITSVLHMQQQLPFITKR